MYNDIHDNVELWQALHRHVAGEKVDFNFLNGDIVNELEDEKQMVEHFLDPCTTMFAGETPFLFARGNHECRGGYAREMKKYLSLPDDRYYYAFTQGPARFIVLDCGEDNQDAHPRQKGLAAFEPYRETQLKFLEREIASDAWKSARWRIALFHIPGHLAKVVGTTSLVMKRKFHPLLNAGKTDLVLTGHTHEYTVGTANPKDGYEHPIVIGGGPRAGAATVTLVEADEKNIRVRMTRDDGQQVGELVV
jgi:predicted phosphodiesterase